MVKIVEIVSEIEFVAHINEFKDCLMSQDHSDQKNLWFNIDVPKGHCIKSGDRVRVIIETLNP